MTLKSIIKLFIPPVFYKLKQELFSKKRKFISTIHHINNVKDELVIIGNGPSLNDTIHYHLTKAEKFDWMVVNNFCNTDLFHQIKPKFYVIADPSNLGKLENLSDLLREETIKFTEGIKSATWKMSLILPDFAIDGYLVQQVKLTKNIDIFYYNTKNFAKNKSKFSDLENNLIAPPAQTVLNTCVYLGLVLNFKKIYIHGMDMSWHEDLELDQKTNILYIKDRHFYGTKRRPAILDVNGVKSAKVHEYLMCSVRALESFWQLREYADYKKVQIINMSPHSWVDAFDRIEYDKK